MKAYFIAILTLFTCIATVVRGCKCLNLKTGLTVCSNGKKTTVGIAVWTDKGDMLRYNDHTLPLAQCIQIPCGTGRTGQDG